MKRGRDWSGHAQLIFYSSRGKIGENTKMNRSSELKYIPPTLKKSSGVGNESFTSNTCYLELQFPCLVNQMTKLHILFFFSFAVWNFGVMELFLWYLHSIKQNYCLCFPSWNIFVNSETYIAFFCQLYMPAHTVGLWCIKELHIYLGICWKHVAHFFLCPPPTLTTPHTKFSKETLTFVMIKI